MQWHHSRNVLAGSILGFGSRNSTSLQHGPISRLILGTRSSFVVFIYASPGLEPRIDLLGDNLTDVLCDIHALQQMRESSDPNIKCAMPIQEQDSQQA